MTVWACARQGEPTTYHDTESGALAEATLIAGTTKGECVVFPVEVERAQEAARTPETGHSGDFRAGVDSGATEDANELETGDLG